MIDFTLYAVGEHRLTCPECGTRPSKKDLGLTVRDDGSGVARCFKCDYVETFRPERGAHVAKPSAPLIQGRQDDEQHETLSNYWRGVWSRCKPLSGIALDYLNARRCCIPPADSDLRWHPNLKHPCGYSGPALVARITDVLSGEPLSLHRTWITATGKADVSTPRLLLAAHRKQGGAVRLWPVEAPDTCLGVGEGIETALSLAWAIKPAWSLIDAGNLAEFPVLDGIETLVIARDNDPAGIRASNTCGQRWVNAGRTVAVSQQTQNDINDMVMEIATA